ncbi:MAG TPA: hypothetical protein VLF60_01765 [Candidatus Saccharimonadales bacterium]|nr:hypothetical protein [Candidatus Saccharimonadales bacterium]
MTRFQTLKHHNIATDEAADILGQVLVKPRHMTKLVVGMYESSIPEPKFRLEFESSASDAINASLFKFDDKDHYTLVYQFQNYGDRPCRVTVKEV